MTERSYAHAPRHKKTQSPKTTSYTGTIASPSQTIQPVLPDLVADELTPAQVLQLQSTVGNRMVYQMVQQKPLADGHIQRGFLGGLFGGSNPGGPLTIHNTNWNNAISLDATGGSEGVQGVFFIRSQTNQLILKIAKGGARNVMAAELMKDQGVQAPTTRGIPMTSKEGKQLIKVMKNLVKKDSASPNAAGKLGRLGEGDTLLVMESMDDALALTKLMQEGDGGFQGNFPELVAKMWSSGFFRQLGRIHAADMFMGNQDRLDRLNMKNVFISVSTGESIGLDLDLEAIGFDNATGDLGNTHSQNAPSIAGNEYKDWVTLAIEGGEGEREYINNAGKKQTGFSGYRGAELWQADFTKAVDPQKITQVFQTFKNEFLGFFAGSNSPAIKQRGTLLAGQNWVAAQMQFVGGVRQGMKTINQGMESGRYEQKMGDLEGTYGKDPVMDMIVFKIKHMYYLQKRKNPQVDEATLRAQLVDYAKFLHTGTGANPFDQPAEAAGPVPGQWQTGVPSQKWKSGAAPI